MFACVCVGAAAAACSAGGTLRSGSGGAGGGGAGGAGGLACVLDTGAADWFAGTWTGVQGSETWTVTNAGGCSIWRGTSGATLCDSCTGTYTITGPGAGTLDASCAPLASCSVSPIHMTTGAISLTGCNFTYAYAFSGASGSGNATFDSAMRVGAATADACGGANGGI